jgi:hypothetical protein
MTGRKGSSLGLALGVARRYPGGSGWSRIFWSVSQWMPNSRQTDRLLWPSARMRRRISARSSMSVYTHRPHGRGTRMGWMKPPSWSRSRGRGHGRPRFLTERRSPTGATFFEGPSQSSSPKTFRMPSGPGAGPGQLHALVHGGRDHLDFPHHRGQVGYLALRVLRGV